MWPRRFRLKDHQAFPQIYSRGKRRSGSLMGVTYLPRVKLGSDPVPSQLAVVVSKKVSRKAVQRNRVKRRIRSALHSLLPQIQPGYWIVISARGPILTATWDQICQEISRLLGKARLLRDPVGEHGQSSCGQERDPGTARIDQ